MANILITGANGQLGSELRKIGFSPLDEVFFTDVAELYGDRKVYPGT